MYRKYLHLSKQFITAFCSQKQPHIIINYENYIAKRWAGHSKWQNIKNVKQSADQMKSTTFAKHCKKISLAVKEGGEDVKLNFKLRALIEEAKKMCIPNSTIENAIKSYKTNTAEKPYWLVYTGPKGVVVAFEAISANPRHAQSKLNTILKKFEFKLEKQSDQFITERGIVMCQTPNASESGYDKALEDGIEVGVQEVFEEDKMLIFQCYPNQVDLVHKKLLEKGYNVESANIEVEFSNYVNIDENDSNEINLMINKVHEQFEDVLRAVPNTAQTS